MRTVLALARKDLRVLFRARSGLFFTFVWPVIVAVLFGFVFAGQSQAGRASLRVMVIDDDNTDGSRAFIERLETSGEVRVETASHTDAEDMVRLGQRSAYVVLKPGFGAGSQRMFYGAPRQVEIGIDPARHAEAAMLEGLLVKHALNTFLQSPASAPGGTASAWQPLAVTKAAVEREARGPSNGFEVTFPQGVMWGIIGCIMTFAVSLVTERVRGTFVRLQMAPITRAHILAGKALACFASIALVQVMLFTIGGLFFDVSPSSVPLLILICASASLGFVGFMMMISGFGRNEQAVSGAGWAMLMPMTMFGGGMMPQFVMPAWMQTVGNFSPVKWAILGLEGALWRDFTLTEMLLPCGILLAFGAVCFAVGLKGLRN